MGRIVTAATFGLLCLVGATAAQDATAPTPQEIIAARQAAFNLSGAAFGGMKAVIDAGGSVRTQGFAASSITRWARAMPGLFPVGTGVDVFPEGNKARPEIWTDRAGFEARAADYAAAAAKLQELARADDAAGFAAQWAVVRQTCQACHDAYRVE